MCELNETIHLANTCCFLYGNSADVFVSNMIHRKIYLLHRYQAIDSVSYAYT